MLITCAGKNGKWHEDIAYNGIDDGDFCPLCAAIKEAKEQYDKGWKDAEANAAKFEKLPPGEPDPRD